MRNTLVFILVFIMFLICLGLIFKALTPVLIFLLCFGIFFGILSFFRIREYKRKGIKASIWGGGCSGCDLCRYTRTCAKKGLRYHLFPAFAGKS
ncbi:MAG: hypothetical protein DDT27_00274 [Dehalococcoidia bacterium]|nr:hypothetical protein [Chloroflexota bacterium]MBT9159646.1 hypothetical protein [Chloroflexota bacterium]MBT9161737.1 hypothetical protein [Chloroflexota bacterium]